MVRFRSLSIAKRRDNRSETPDSLYTMSSTSTTTMSHRRSSSRDYDTGFPHLPRTTTWRHPEANTAPDACISAEDVDPAKALHRHHLSFLHHKYKRTTSHGFITTEMEEEYHKSQEALDFPDSAIGLEDGKALALEDGYARPSKDGTESIDRTDGSLKGGHSPTSPAKSHFEQNGGSPRKRSLFRKIRDHRH